MVKAHRYWVGQKGIYDMLKTPLGDIELFIDDIPIDYKEKSVPLDKYCINLNGRYAIVINFTPDNNEHIISCKIKGYIPSGNDGIEKGEGLECKSFYNNNVKLSIGMEGDTIYFQNGERCSEYDYDNGYLCNGVFYHIFKSTKTEKYVFGISWINNCSEQNDTETWFGADPTMGKLKKAAE